jgi:hypothetical protein
VPASGGPVSAMGCAEVRDLAPELTLGVLGGAERAEAILHVNECGPCRSFVGELTDAADTLPLLVREAEPPPGFERRVLSSIGGERGRGIRRWVTVVAATTAAATILSIVAVRLVDHGRDEQPAARRTAISEARSLPMVDATGQNVGWAFVSDGRPAAVGVSVAYSLPTGRYGVELLTGEAGRQVDLGRITVTGGGGSWAGTARLPRSGSASIALVDATGNIVCRAAFPA